MFDRLFLLYVGLFYTRSTGRKKTMKQDSISDGDDLGEIKFLNSETGSIKNNKETESNSYIGVSRK